MQVSTPNYTRTPNSFFDNIMKTLDEGEMRVLLVIMRQTFGWHKMEDWITLQALADKTGYARRSVARIILRLIDKKIISKRVDGPLGLQKTYYSLVDDHNEPESEGSDATSNVGEHIKCGKKKRSGDQEVTTPVTYRSPPTSDPPVTRPVTDGYTPRVTGRSWEGVTSGSPTKETHTKETLQKKQQQEKAPAAVAFFGREKQAEPVIFDFGISGLSPGPSLCHQCQCQLAPNLRLAAAMVVSSPDKGVSAKHNMHYQSPDLGKKDDIRCIIRSQSVDYKPLINLNLDEDGLSPPRNRLHPCLEGIDILNCNKIFITQRFFEDTVKDAIEWAVNQKDGKSLFENIKFACVNGLKYDPKSSRPRIYDCLKPMDMNEREKFEITRTYIESVVTEAVKWALKPGRDIKKTLAAALKWACKNEIKLEEDSPKKTVFDRICDWFKNGEKYNNAECYLKPEVIAFERGMKHGQMKIDKYFSWAKFKDLCMDFGIECPQAIPA